MSMGDSIGIIGGADGPTSLFVSSSWGGFGGFGIFGVVFFIVFALVLILFVRTLFHGAKQGVKNSRSPQLTVSAQVVTKRTKVWGDHARTSYYVTFQVDSGDRMEMQVTGEEYGLLVEGDRGQLTFQGTRFLTFERQ